MKKIMIKQKVLILICTLFSCILFSSCRYSVPEEKRVDIISGIAETVNDNFTSQDGETPLMISMTEIEKLTDADSDLKKYIEKYDDIKEYRVYLLDNNMVMVVTENLGQGVRGYVVSNEELKGTVMTPGLGFDADQIGIINRIEDSNVYYFRAGQ
ncbi:MAG: hypothetical protein IKO32_00260 [Lachnospiraceae bacterium]|nr:hypothetical protein [Lachnospiraceae bacterium]